jgi:hypothetical protein
MEHELIVERVFDWHSNAGLHRAHEQLHALLQCLHAVTAIAASRGCLTHARTRRKAHTVGTCYAQAR